MPTEAEFEADSEGVGEVVYFVSDRYPDDIQLWPEMYRKAALEAAEVYQMLNPTKRVRPLRAYCIGRDDAAFPDNAPDRIQYCLIYEVQLTPWLAQ